MGNDIENTGKTQLDMDLKKLNEYEMMLLMFFFYLLNALYAN